VFVLLIFKQIKVNKIIVTMVEVVGSHMALWDPSWNTNKGVWHELKPLAQWKLLIF